MPMPQQQYPWETSGAKCIILHAKEMHLEMLVDSFKFCNLKQSDKRIKWRSFEKSKNYLSSIEYVSMCILYSCNSEVYVLDIDKLDSSEVDIFNNHFQDARIFPRFLCKFNHTIVSSKHDNDIDWPSGLFPYQKKLLADLDHNFVVTFDGSVVFDRDNKMFLFIGSNMPMSRFGDFDAYVNSFSPSQFRNQSHNMTIAVGGGDRIVWDVSLGFDDFSCLSAMVDSLVDRLG